MQRTLRNTKYANPKNTNQEEIDNKKKALQQKFIEKAKKGRENNDIQEKSDDRKIIKINSKEDKKKDKKIKELQQKISLIKNEENKLKTTISNLKKEINTLNSEYKTEMITLENKNKKLQEAVKNYNEFYKDYCFIKEENERLLTREKNQTKQMNRIQKVLEKKNYLMVEMQNEVKFLKVENTMKKKEYDLLQQELAKRPIVTKIQIVTEERNKPYKMYSKDPIIIKKPDFKINEGCEQFGVIIFYANVYIFKSVEDKEYLIDVTKSQVPLKRYIGYSCKAIVTNDDYAVIDNIYKDDVIDNTSIVNRKSKDDYNFKFKDQEEFIVNADKYSIMVIGSINKNKYVEELKSLGFKDVLWCDSYEISPTRINVLLKTYDIILCCTAHSRHSAFYMVKKYASENDINNLRCQIIKHDNSFAIKSRARYVVTNLEEL